jgi:undecaprenyl-diphosphatase
VLTALWTAVGLALVRSPVDGWDGDLAETLVRHRRPVLDTLTGIATWPAETVTVALLWLLAIAVLARVTSDWVAPVFLSVALAGEKSTYLFASLIVDRPRPPVPPLGHLHATASWPSGHVGAAVCLYGALVVLAFRHRWPRPPAVRAGLLVVAGAVVAGVMVSRCYRGMHYLTDVIGGLVLGLTWLALAGAIVRRAERRVGGRLSRS